MPDVKAQAPSLLAVNLWELRCGQVAGDGDGGGDREIKTQVPRVAGGKVKREKSHWRGAAFGSD